MNIPWPSHSADDPALAVLSIRRPLWQRMLSWLVWPWRKPRIEVHWIGGTAIGNGGGIGTWNDSP